MFKWSCLALAVVFLGLLTWMSNDTRAQTRRVHEEIRHLREEIDRSKPTLTLQGEVNPLEHSDKVPHFIGINYNPPFASPPHLTFPDGHSGWQIAIQEAGRFGVNREISGLGNGSKFKWKAEGQPAKSKLEEQNDAILRELQGLRQVVRQNEAILRELEGLRHDMRKRIEGDGKK